MSITPGGCGDVDVNVTVNVNGQQRESGHNRKPRRRTPREHEQWHEFYSNDGWSWMGVRTGRTWTHVELFIELQVKRAIWGTWIYETGGSLKQLQFRGHIETESGTRVPVDVLRHLDSDTYTSSILVNFDGTDLGWPTRVVLDLVEKTHGYWSEEGPDSHVCRGTIDRTF